MLGCDTEEETEPPAERRAKLLREMGDAVAVLWSKIQLSGQKEKTAEEKMS